MSENVPLHLLCFPLEITKKIKTLSGMNVFHLIWLKCCFNHTFSNITVTEKDRKRIALHRNCYSRGLEELESVELITVDRQAGKACRITINENFIDQKAKSFIKERGI